MVHLSAIVNGPMFILVGICLILIMPHNLTHPDNGTANPPSTFSITMCRICMIILVLLGERMIMDSCNSREQLQQLMSSEPLKLMADERLTLQAVNRHKLRLSPALDVLSW